MTERNKFWYQDPRVQRRVASLIRKAITPQLFNLHYSDDNGRAVKFCHGGSYCRALHSAVDEISKVIDEFEESQRND